MNARGPSYRRHAWFLGPGSRSVHPPLLHSTPDGQLGFLPLAFLVMAVSACLLGNFASQSSVLPHTYLEDQPLLPPVRHGELDLPVQAPWPQQGRVQRVRPAATNRHLPSSKWVVAHCRQSRQMTGHVVMRCRLPGSSSAEPLQDVFQQQQGWAPAGFQATAPVLSPCRILIDSSSAKPLKDVKQQEQC